MDKVNEKQTALDNETDPEKKTALQNELSVLNEQYQALLSKYGAASYNELYTKSQQANNDYNTKAQAAEQKKSAAESSISSLENRKLELESKIADTTTKLNEYN